LEDITLRPVTESHQLKGEERGGDYRLSLECLKKCELGKKKSNQLKVVLRVKSAREVNVKEREKRMEEAGTLKEFRKK